MSIIYAYSEGLDGETFYIGKTNNLDRRHYQHINFSGKDNYYFRLALCYCRESNTQPELRILEECEDYLVLEREKAWINFGISQGWNLVNKCGSASSTCRMFIYRYIFNKVEALRLKGDKNFSLGKDISNYLKIWDKF